MSRRLRTMWWTARRSRSAALATVGLRSGAVWQWATRSCCARAASSGPATVSPRRRRPLPLRRRQADMALNVSAWSIRQPKPPLVLFAILIVLGFGSFRSLPVTQMPNIDVPVVTVAIAQAGAAPSELETQVARPVEDAVAGLTGVKHV